ncbi:hypothetical protein [Streptomyces sp. NPDC048106]|uniref:hypothetical protein n=1 Tax=Streptomyces sp. NPDC048106 TaxID=3155750 RepID=UPI003451C33C
MNLLGTDARERPDRGTRSGTPLHRRVPTAVADPSPSRFPPPRVMVVCHASGMRGGLPHFGEALRRGQERADGVAEAFRSALAVHLERLQAGGETVTLLADIEVTARSEGNAPPHGTASDPDPAAARRQPFVVVELPRPERGDGR